MKHSILIYLIIIPAFCYCQKRENKDLKKYVDSIIDKRSKQNLYDLHECDTVLALMNYPQEYKYWNYYYNDCSQKDVFKVSISFNGLPEKLCYYYENNMVIKRQLFKIINKRAKLIWSIYFDADKEILYEGKSPDNIGYDKVEQAYYFLSLAKEYLEKTGCH